MSVLRSVRPAHVWKVQLHAAGVKIAAECMGHRQTLAWTQGQLIYEVTEAYLQISQRVLDQHRQERIERIRVGALQIVVAGVGQ
jgi:hypothetical protein